MFTLWLVSLVSLMVFDDRIKYNVYVDKRLHYFKKLDRIDRHTTSARLIFSANTVMPLLVSNVYFYHKSYMFNLDLKDEQMKTVLNILKICTNEVILLIFISSCFGKIISW